MRKVNYVRFHSDTMYIPTFGDAGKVLPAPNKTLDNLLMVAYDNYLDISFSYKGLKKHVRVPFGNISLMDLAPEEVKETKSSK